MTLQESKQRFTAPTEKSENNPYLNARRTWNDQLSGIMSVAQTWQLVGLLGLMTGFLGLAGVLYLSSQSRLVPYIVAVDKLGQATAIGPAERATADNKLIIHAAIASFIQDARLVTPDIALQRQAIFRLYAVLAPHDPATNYMNQWLNGSEAANPFKRAARETVTTQITSVLPQTNETWQVDWQESIYDRQGVLVNQYRMRALLTLYIVPPQTTTSEEQIRRNPLGIYIRELSWAKQVD